MRIASSLTAPARKREAGDEAARSTRGRGLAALHGVLAFIVYHGDSGELERHLAFVATLYRMAPVVALACVWERLAALGQRRWSGAQGWGDPS